jgi:hypothetical protein
MGMDEDLRDTQKEAEIITQLEKQGIYVVRP